MSHLPIYNPLFHPRIYNPTIFTCHEAVFIEPRGKKVTSRPLSFCNGDRHQPHLPVFLESILNTPVLVRMYKFSMIQKRFLLSPSCFDSHLVPSNSFVRWTLKTTTCVLNKRANVHHGNCSTRGISSLSTVQLATLLNTCLVNWRQILVSSVGNISSDVLKLYAYRNNWTVNKMLIAGNVVSITAVSPMWNVLQQSLWANARFSYY